jgi:7-cyano-7-deazaguanine synthase in queuosine biosynthesis
MKKAIVLLSGGPRSKAAMKNILREGYQVFVVVVGHGQRHDGGEIKELNRALKFTDQMAPNRWAFAEVRLPFGSDHHAGEARLAILLTIGNFYAEVFGASVIVTGAQRFQLTGAIRTLKATAVSAKQGLYRRIKRRLVMA